MKLNNLIEGLTILNRYYDKPDGYHTCAEHDMFYAGPTDRPLSAGRRYSYAGAGLVPD